MILSAAVLLAGCQTPAVYELRFRDPGAVSVELTGNPGDPSSGARLPARESQAAPGASAQAAGFDAPAISLGPLEASGYRASVTRGDDGSISLSMSTRDASKPAETAMLVGPDGKIPLKFPTSTGDVLDFPGWHQRGVTAVGPGPLLQRDGQQRLELVYRPSYPQQQAMGRTVSVGVSLVTPLSNVAAVTRQERPPRPALTVATVVSAVILAGGTFIAVPRGDDTKGARNFRLGVGLPLMAVGLAGGAFSLTLLLRPDRDVPVPIERASGAP